MITGALLLATLAHAQGVDTDADGLPDRYDPCPNDLTNAIVNDMCADGERARTVSEAATGARDTSVPDTVAPETPRAPTVSPPDATVLERARGRYRTGRAVTWVGIAALPVGGIITYVGAETFDRAASPDAQALGFLAVIGGLATVVISPGTAAAGVWTQRAALRSAACPRTWADGDLVAIGTLGGSYVIAPTALVGYPLALSQTVGMDRDARSCGLR